MPRLSFSPSSQLNELFALPTEKNTLVSIGPSLDTDVEEPIPSYQEHGDQVLGPRASGLGFGLPPIGYIENVSRAGSRSSSTSIRVARWDLT